MSSGGPWKLQRRCGERAVASIVIVAPIERCQPAVKAAVPFGQGKELRVLGNFGLDGPRGEASSRAAFKPPQPNSRLSALILMCSACVAENWSCHRKGRIQSVSDWLERSGYDERVRLVLYPSPAAHFVLRYSCPRICFFRESLDSAVGGISGCLPQRWWRGVPWVVDRRMNHEQNATVPAQRRRWDARNGLIAPALSGLYLLNECGCILT